MHNLLYNFTLKLIFNWFKDDLFCKKILKENFSFMVLFMILNAFLWFVFFNNEKREHIKSA